MSKSNDKRPKNASGMPERKLEPWELPYTAKKKKKQPSKARPRADIEVVALDGVSRLMLLEDGVKQLLMGIGEDPTRAGLRETPTRVAKAWLECWGVGYKEKSVDDLITLFPDVEYCDTQMVTVRDISFHSHCEHHMAAFSGRAHISYIPSKKGVIGLSKLARVTDYFSRKLQTQERLTNEIADFLGKHLSKHVAVKLEATHGCMVSRGVMQPNAVTVTMAIRGDYKTDPSMRAEFYDAIGS